jgi:hypothetical protein
MAGRASPTTSCATEVAEPSNSGVYSVGYCASMPRMRPDASADAADTVTPSRSRPIASRKCQPREVRSAAGSSCNGDHSSIPGPE